MTPKIYFLFSFFLVTAGCSNAQQDGTSRLTKKIDEYLSAYEEAGFSGSILVAEAGKATLSKGYGYANDSTWTKTSPQTIWTIGSITKPMTAMSILKLEQMNKLLVTDMISKHIDGLTGEMAEITIHQLLTHTSGLPEYSGYDSEMMNTQGLIDFINKSSLRFEPGEKFAYSNVGYALLGIIIEKTSGQAYESFLREHIFIPAGMLNTGYVKPNWDKRNFAVGYTNGETWGNVFDNNNYDQGVSWNLKANGGILSTAEDMYRWHIALKKGSILPKEVLGRMYGKYIQTPRDFNPFNEKNEGHYGYGWGLTKSANFKPIIMHGGSNDVFVAGYMHYPEEDLFLFIASNRVSKNAADAILDLDKIISKKKYSLPKPTVIADTEITKSFEGEYSFEDGSRFTIALSKPPVIIEGSLTIRPMDKPAYKKIVGDPIDIATAKKVEEFIKDVLEKSRLNEPYHTSVNTAKESSKSANKKEDEDISIGVDQRSIASQLESFWKQQVDEKGEYLTLDIWGAVGVGDRYWTQVQLVFENGFVFMNFSIGQEDGEIKRFSTNDRPVGLILKPKSSSKFQEANSGGTYEFIRNKSSGNVKIKGKLKGEKLAASKSLS